MVGFPKITQFQRVQLAVTWNTWKVRCSKVYHAIENAQSMYRTMGRLDVIPFDTQHLSCFWLVVFCMTLYKKTGFRTIGQHLGAYLWGVLDQDPQSKVTRLIVRQRNWWIYSDCGLTAPFVVPGSVWSRITNPGPDHPHRIVPYSKTWAGERIPTP